jgi:LPS O-antigen subunit length determinant protein (WzzB/FepE family)
MEEKKRDFNSFSLLYFIWSWRKALLIICCVAAVLSFFFSTKLFIQPMFKATAIVYAPRTNSTAKILVNEQNYNERLDIKAYGVAEETEQMMQILASRDIQDSIIKKFNLVVHYDIDTTAKYWHTKLYKTVANCITIKRTQYGAISISVMDSDPTTAAAIANEITVQLDNVKNRIEHERAVAAYQLLEKQLKRYDAEIERINDSINVTMAHGVFEYETQSDRMMQQRAIAVAQGNTAAIQRLDKELANFAKWAAKAEDYRQHLILFREYHTLCRSKMMDARMDMDNAMPTKFVVQYAIAPDKKEYPKKMMIMAVSTIGAFIFSILVLLVLDNIKRFKVVSKREEQN